MKKFHFEKGNFVCIFPWLTDSTAIKCTGQICETVAEKFNINSYIVTYKNEEYPKYRKYCARTKLFFLSGQLHYGGWRLFRDLIWFIILNSVKIDILYLYHFPEDKIVIPFLGVLYKIFNKSGILYVRLESDIEQLPAEFPTIPRIGPVNIIKNYINIRFYEKLDLLGVIDSDSFDLSKRIMLWKLSHEKIKIQLNGFRYYEDICKTKFERKEDIIVLAGRLNSEQKGLDVFLEALRYFDLQNWKVLLLGDLDKEQKCKIKSIEDQYYPSQNKIQIQNYISDVSIYLNTLSRAKIFCLPSRFDGIPLVIPDAMAQGCVIVGSDLFGIKKIATNDGECGFCFPNGNPVELAAILNNIIKGEYNLVEISKKSRERAENIFHWDSIIANLDLGKFIKKIDI